ncbi:MAG: hypothetical protein IJ863_01060 [Spirochaetales bacterium]|nr:hypothetical protein [Spirochaetales bacterium]
MKKFIVSLLLFPLAFCAFAKGISEDVSSLSVAAPSGAPAIALASLAVDNPDQYTFVAAETISAEFANSRSDFIIAPINAGAKLYRMGKSTYKLGAVVSWGNLFIASQRADFKLEDINGAEIVLFGENTINASIALYSLERNGIVPAKVSYLGSAANTQQLLLSDPQAIVMTAEPALTAARNKNPGITGISVNSIYGDSGFTQAGLFVKAELAQSSPEVVDAYLALLKESCDRCETDLEAVAEAAVKLEILPNVKVATSAIPNCAVRFVPALDAKAQVEATANIDLKQFGGAVPSDDFYYGAE